MTSLGFSSSEADDVGGGGTPFKLIHLVILGQLSRTEDGSALSAILDISSLNSLG